MTAAHQLVSLYHLSYHPCRYVPKGPDGYTDIVIGGDRLTEANCRNIQWTFADADTKDERMDGLIFKFEDWHAIRVLFEVSSQI